MPKAKKRMPRRWEPSARSLAIWALRKEACGDGVAHMLLAARFGGTRAYLSRTPTLHRQPGVFLTMGDMLWLRGVLGVRSGAPWPVLRAALWKAGVR